MGENGSRDGGSTERAEGEGSAAPLMEQLSEELARAAEQHPDDVDKQIEAALQCPCVEDMLQSPCKDTFVSSFTCFMKSDHPEVKGYDCVEHFERFQECLVANPGVIEEFLTDARDNDASK